MDIGFIFPIGLLVVFVFYVVAKYNGIVTMRNNREQSFADIDTQLQLRFDLVPNLIETVKGYAKHEQDTLLAVTQARSLYNDAKTTDDKIEANTMLTGALKSIFALSEAYPDLKANASFLQFQTELSDIENKLAASRRFFNAATNEYNTYIEVFPANFVAQMFGFIRAKGFEIENRAEVSQAPKVTF
ncbi:MAG: LemA family protein [Candidatus Gracilibacteria bacterium]|nr:LemA family protein [Candidatus Gracilibacteria bacterium]